MDERPANKEWSTREEQHIYSTEEFSVGNGWCVRQTVPVTVASLAPEELPA